MVRSSKTCNSKFLRTINVEKQLQGELLLALKTNNSSQRSKHLPRPLVRTSLPKHSKCVPFSMQFVCFSLLLSPAQIYDVLTEHNLKQTVCRLFFTKHEREKKNEFPFTRLMLWSWRWHMTDEVCSVYMTSCMIAQPFLSVASNHRSIRLERVWIEWSAFQTRPTESLFSCLGKQRLMRMQRRLLLSYTDTNTPFASRSE